MIASDFGIDKINQLVLRANMEAGDTGGVSVASKMIPAAN